MVRITPQRDWVLILVLFCLEAFELEQRKSVSLVSVGGWEGQQL